MSWQLSRSPKKRSLPLQCQGWPVRITEVKLISPKKDHCVSSSQVLVRMAVHMDQYFPTLFGMQTHFQGTQTSMVHPTYVLWPTYAVYYQAVAHPTYIL